MMLKVASVCVVQTSAQFSSAQYAGFSGVPAAMPYDLPYAGMGITSEIVYESTSPNLAQQYVGAPVYTEFAMPQYDFSMPQAMPQAMLQAMPQAAQPAVVPRVVPQARQDIPHPNIVKQEQGAYLQKAVENLEAQKQAEMAKHQEEQNRITAEIQAQGERLMANAEAQFQERLKNLESSFKSYESRLEEQAQQLRMQYYQQKANARFEEADKKIAVIYQGGVSLKDLDSLQQAQQVRTANMQQLQSHLQAIQQGSIPPDLLEEDPPVAEPVAEVAEDPPAGAGEENPDLN